MDLVLDFCFQISSFMFWILYSVPFIYISTLVPLSQCPDYFRSRYEYLEIRYLSSSQVAHTCNLSYSGGRDQEDHGSKLAPGMNLGS
jgi:hypothetical protein